MTYAARRADEPCFEIGEPDVVGPGICADRDEVAALLNAKRLIGISSSWDVVVSESTISRVPMPGYSLVLRFEHFSSRNPDPF